MFKYMHPQDKTHKILIQTLDLFEVLYDQIILKILVFTNSQILLVFLFCFVYQELALIFLVFIREFI